MLNTLRGRFILSHILPLLIVIPLMGIATIYLIEEQILMPSLLSELRGNALMLSRMAARDQEIWQDPTYARQLLAQGSFRADGRLMLLDSNGILIASSDPADADRLGTQVEHPGFDAAQQGQIFTQLHYSQTLEDNMADALAPVVGPNGEVLGFIRLSFHYYTFVEQIYQLRYLLTGILAAALLLGAGLGTVLAINVGAPVQQVTHAVYALANGERSEALPERGAEETRRLSRAVNVLFERLRSLEAARKRLLANLIHEIGRPLGALRMGIEALSHGANRDPQFYDELLSGMDQETARLQRLLEDLSHLHEQALGVLELDRQPLDLITWLPGMLNPWQQAALQKRLHWELKLPRVPTGGASRPITAGTGGRQSGQQRHQVHTRWRHDHNRSGRRRPTGLDTGRRYRPWHSTRCTREDIRAFCARWAGTALPAGDGTGTQHRTGTGRSPRWPARVGE